MTEIYLQMRKGAAHENIEDSALLSFDGNFKIRNIECREHFNCKNPMLFAVADGVGGLKGGDQASTFVLNSLKERAIKALENNFETEAEIENIVLNNTPIDAERFEQVGDILLKSLNKELLDYSSSMGEFKSMATTLTSLVFKGDGYGLIHTGNTRISSLNGVFLRQLTHDHTNYQNLLDMGQFDAADNCSRNIISSCLGSGSNYLNQIQVKLFEAKNNVKYFMLTSDGIHEYVEDSFVEDLLANQDIDDLEKTDLLMEESLKHGSTDDKTILLIKV